jgi:hypothetical protein
VTNTAKQVVATAKSTGKAIVRIATKVLNAAFSFSGGFRQKLSVSTDSLLPQSDSPFGRKNSYMLYSQNTSKAITSVGRNESSFDSLDIYCVDCGIRGSTTLAGGISFKLGMS